MLVLKQEYSGRIRSIIFQQDDVIKWKHFQRYWPFVREIHRPPVNFPDKGQWCGVLMFSLICAWLNAWGNIREDADLRRHRANYDVIVVIQTAVQRNHYNDVIMSLMASQITSLTIVYSTVYSGAGQRKHQSSASLAFVRGIHRWPVNSPHKRPVTRKMFPFDDVIMIINVWSDSVEFPLIPGLW